MSNVLDLYDQTYFGFERAAGVTNLLQCVWVYDRAVDIDGLRRFHHRLQQGLLSRRIERSPLPFARYRRFFEEGARLVIPSTRHVPAVCVDPRIKQRSRLHWWRADRIVRLRCQSTPGPPLRGILSCR